MRPSDLSEVLRLAELVHRGLPESLATFEGRLRLFSEGCLALPLADGLGGYAFAHPNLPYMPPALDSAPEQITGAMRQFFIHDVVVLPELRGRGLAAAAIRRLLQVAEDYESAALISVYGTAKFWEGFGFRPAVLAEPGKLSSYGNDAVFMVRPRGGGREAGRP